MHRVLYIVLLVTMIGNAQSKMNAAEAKLLREQVKELAQSTQTIVSDFTQYKHLDFLSNDIKTSGKLAFKSPDKVKWEYLDPFKYSVIFKQEILYINDEGNKSNVDIGSSKLFKQLNKLIINSVKGDMFDDNEFDIEYYKKGIDSEVYFKPKNEKLLKYIKAFHIVFNKKGEVAEVKMVEPSNDYTKIIFKNRVTNKTLSDAIFIN